ncbi:MAG: permease-like cell division protein FtsX, partial [Xanthomonadales bacterium]|nr:permease-like cell division protein FtsX [Xanthomonadales bacterium]
MRIRLGAWMENHGYTIVSSFGRLARRPVTTLMTLIVIAIALAMPAGLYLLLENAAEMSAGWQGAGQVNVFLTQETDQAGADEAAAAIAALEEIAAVETVSPAQALAEFKAASDFSDALDALAENPLPYVLLADLQPGLEAARIGPLTSAIEARSEVDFAQFDMQWLIRFNAILSSVERLIHVIAALLVTGVLLIVGNT